MKQSAIYFIVILLAVAAGLRFGFLAGWCTMMLGAVILAWRETKCAMFDPDDPASKHRDAQD